MDDKGAVTVKLPKDFTFEKDGTFRPDNPIIRAEFVAISVRFYKAYGIEVTEEVKKLAFIDVSGSYWAVDYIDEAAANSWIVGYLSPFSPRTAATFISSLTAAAIPRMSTFSTRWTRPI